MAADPILVEHAADAICHLQTIGRTSGRPRTIEIWFATDGERIYLLAAAATAHTGCGTCASSRVFACASAGARSTERRV